MKDDLADSADEALSYAVRRYTVGLGPLPKIISRFTHAHKEIPIASGVLISFGAKTYIVTANHFLDDLSLDEIEVLFSPDWGKDVIHEQDASSAQLKEILAKVVPREASRGTPLQFIDCTREVIPNSDVSAIEIPKPTVPVHCSILKYESASLLECNSEDRYYLHGLPSKASSLKPDHATKTANIRSGWFTEGVERVANPTQEDWGTDSRAIFESSIHYALKPVQPVDHLSADEALRRFTGYSGGGVWAVPNLTRKGSDLWAPTLKLCGIQSAYHTGLGLLKVTRASVISSVLDRRPS